MLKKKLDKDGFIFPLAVGALALLFFGYYFLSMNSKKVATEKPILGVEDLDVAAREIDSQSPDAFTEDLNLNSKDAAGF